MRVKSELKVNSLSRSFIAELLFLSAVLLVTFIAANLFLTAACA